MIKSNRTKLFYDFEFTSLHQHTTPISLGVVSSCGREFYAEFTDYDRKQVDEWLEENVIKHLTLHDYPDFNSTEIGNMTYAKGDHEFVSRMFILWLSQFDAVEFWGDCAHYDGVLLNELLGGAFNLPSNVYHIYFDISTVFRLYGVDPDISREDFIDVPVEGYQHNALYDSIVIRECYEKLHRNREPYKSRKNLNK